MRPFRPLVGLAVVGALLAACAGNTSTGDGSGRRTSSSSATPSAAEFPLTLADDDGVSVTLDAPPTRIVTFAPSVTEILFALGLGDEIVGVSGPFDDYPPAATHIAQVGGAGDFGVDPNIEKVVSLDPDLFLTIEGGDAWKDRLRSLDVPVFTIDATGLDDLLHDIETVGALTGARARAEALVTSMREEDRRIEDAVAAEPRVTCFFEVYYPPLTTTGPDTFISDLLDRAGCDSVSANATTDYPEWSVEDLVKEDPQVYLVSSESGASPAAVAKRPGFEAIDAVAAGRVVPIDSDLVSRAGPRIVDGLRLLADALHPGALSA